MLGNVVTTLSLTLVRNQKESPRCACVVCGLRRSPTSVCLPADKASRSGYCRLTSLHWQVAYVRHTSVNGSHPNVDLTYTRSVVFIRHTHVREHARAVVERRVYVRTSANVSPTLSETSIAGPTVSTAFYDIGDVGAVISHQLR